MKKIAIGVIALGVATIIAGIALLLLASNDATNAVALLMIIFGPAMVFVGCILGVIHLNYRGNAAKNWSDGKVGVGTILESRHSGRYGNIRTYAVDMSVESEDGHIFSGTMDPQIVRRNLANLAPGVKLPVCYRSSAPSKLYVPHGPLLARAQLFYEFIRQRDGVFSQTTLNAKYHGLDCRTIVQGIRESGYREGPLIQFSLDLRVFTPDGRQFPSTARVLLTESQYELLHTIGYLEAKYLPGDTSEVAVRIPRG